ncbi:unnamed protein product, partial [Symbiodinium pilosum]
AACITGFHTTKLDAEEGGQIAFVQTRVQQVGRTKKHRKVASVNISEPDGVCVDLKASDLQRPINDVLQEHP